MVLYGRQVFQVLFKKKPMLTIYTKYQPCVSIFMYTDQFLHTYSTSLKIQYNIHIYVNILLIYNKKKYQVMIIFHMYKQTKYDQRK